jgi:predicted ester cyclase
MSITNNRTLDVDRIFVRDLIFKDASNRPISSNKLLMSRGDGGTYFGNLPLSTNSTFYQAFNEFRAGSNLVFTASNAFNKLWFEPGAGIQFFSTTVGAQPKLWIAATAPEQLQIVGGSTLNFSSLTDNLFGGRTLKFASDGDVQISISDGTVYWYSATTSSYSSFTSLVSTLGGVFDAVSTLIGPIYSSINANSEYISSVLSNVNDVSSFLFSTFQIGPGDHRNLLQVPYIRTSDISTNTLQASTATLSSIEASTVRIGCNILYDNSLTGNWATEQTVILSSGILSTYTDFFNIKDDYSRAHFAIRKDRYESFSTFDTTSFQTLGRSVEVGMFPTLSTPGTSIYADKYLPILQQIEILEQRVESTIGGNVSTQTAYSLQNIANLDAIRGSNGIVFNAPLVTMSALQVSSFLLDQINISSLVFNDIIGANASISTLIVSSSRTRTADISTARVSTLITNNLSARALNVSTINTSSIFASTIITQQLNASTLLVSTQTTREASISTARISSLVVDSISSRAISTATLQTQQASISSLLVSTGRITNVIASSIDVQNIYNSTGLYVYAPFVWMSSLMVSSINNLTPGTGSGGPQLSTFERVYTNVIYPSTLGGSVTISTLTVSSVIGEPVFSSIRFGTGFTDILYASTLVLSSLIVSSLSYNSSLDVSTLFAASATIDTLNFNTAIGNYLESSNGVFSSLTFLESFGGIASTMLMNTDDIMFTTGAGCNLDLSTLRVSDFAYIDVVSSGDIVADYGTFSTLVGDVVSATSLNGDVLMFSTGVGSNLDLSTLHVSDFAYIDVVSSGDIVADYGTFSTLVGDVVSATSLNGDVLMFSTGLGESLNAELIGFNYAAGTTLDVQTISSAVVVAGGISSHTVSTGNIEFSTASGQLMDIFMGKISSLIVSSMAAGSIYVSDIYVSSFASLPNARFSTVEWSTGYGMNTLLSTTLISTIMGFDAPIFTFDAKNKRVGLNLGPTQQPRATFDVGGIIYANAFVTSSDRRLKKDILPLEVIDLPDAYRYTYIADGVEDIGCLADEVMAIAPECVTTGGDGMKAVNYAKLVPLCLTAIKSLMRRVARLESLRD